MLKEVTGTNSFDERMEKMKSALEEAKGKKTVLGQILKEIGNKLDGLSSDKEEYARIEAVELKKKAY